MTIAAALPAPAADRPARRRRCRRVGLALLCDRAVNVEHTQATARPASRRQVEAWVPSEYAA